METKVGEVILNEMSDERVMLVETRLGIEKLNETDMKFEVRRQG